MVTFDHCFEKVVRTCAEVKRDGQQGTWITEDMVEAYKQLHDLGYAHSGEAWYNGELVGGLYGVSLGAVFFGESMFHTRSNASKVVFAYLIELLQGWQFQLIDCQMPTKHLANFGAENMTREQFLEHLQSAIQHAPAPNKWTNKVFPTDRSTSDFTEINTRNNHNLSP